MVISTSDDGMALTKEKHTTVEINVLCRLNLQLGFRADSAFNGWFEQNK